MLQIQWGGKNQSGAGTTIGEEVEQANSFLSRVAITTKYMTKSGKLSFHLSCHWSSISHYTKPSQHDYKTLYSYSKNGYDHNTCQGVEYSEKGNSAQILVYTIHEGNYDISS